MDTSKQFDEQQEVKHLQSRISLFINNFQIGTMLNLSGIRKSVDVKQIFEIGQTSIMDRRYKNHNNFDQLQEQVMHFVCRIKGNTTKTCLKELSVEADSIVFYDAIVLLGQAGISETKKALRLMGYNVGSKNTGLPQIGST